MESRSTFDENNEEDKELLATMKYDQHARDEVVLRNLRLVYNLALRICKRQQRNKDDVIMEYVQQGILGLLQAIDQYDPVKADFSTFATLKIRGQLKYITYQAQKDTIKEPLGDVETGKLFVTPMHSLIRTDIYSVLHIYLARLKPVQQQVVSMYFLDGVESKDIAAALGCNVKWVSQVRVNAINRLNELLAAREQEFMLD